MFTFVIQVSSAITRNHILVGQGDVISSALCKIAS